MKGIFCGPPFNLKARIIPVVLLLLAYASSFAGQLNSYDKELGVLKVGSEVYSNVTVTAVTPTDIYFSYSGGMGNAKLEHLDPELQKRFHFDPQKASLEEQAEKRINANFSSWIRQQTNRTATPIRTPLDPYISVEAADGAIQYKYYDPVLARPHHLTDGGLARIDCSFNIVADFAVHPVSAIKNGTSRFQIDTARISIEMPITITMPATPTERLKNHVEGHKKIYDYFYALGSKAAERAARVAARRTLTPAITVDQDSPEAQFQRTVKAAAQAEYWKYTKYPAEAATRYYDNLTDYGSNLADSDQAAQEAIEHCEVQIPDGATDTAQALGDESR